MTKHTIESLTADVAELRKRVAALEAAAGPAQPTGVAAPQAASGRPADAGVPQAPWDEPTPRQFVLSPVIVMPTPDELRQRYEAVIAAHLALNWERPAAGSNLPDAHYADEHYSDFKLAFEYIAGIYRTEATDKRLAPFTWCDRVQDWQRGTGRGSRPITVRTFAAAALAHGDVLVELGANPALHAFGLSAHTGRPSALARGMEQRMLDPTAGAPAHR